MPRTRWFAVTLVTALWSAAPDGASAQIVPVPAHIQFTTHLDMTYTGNGQSVRCTSPEEIEAQPPIAEAVIYPEIGDTGPAHTTIYCGEVSVNVLRSITTQETTTQVANAVVPFRAYMRIKIDILVPGADESITVYEAAWSTYVSESTMNMEYFPNDLPGVVFHQIYDSFSSSFWL